MKFFLERCARHYHRRIALLVTGLLVLVLATLAPHASAAQDTQRCFVETGLCISGNIRAYWEQNGGLPVFGYPITALRTETVEGNWTGPTQWFERDRLEDHSNERKGVLAGRLGARYLQLQSDYPQPPTEQQRRGCVFFPQTGFNVCDRFGSYWQRNGGLARFGFPLTPVLEQQVGGTIYQVQYFERRRMEYHPEYAGTASEVQLGLLGNDLFGTVPGELTTYRSADGTWSVQYPAFLHPEDLGDGTVIFISRDRQTFAAIDSFNDGRDLYGTSGEELRNRARATLTRIYGQGMRDEVVISQWPAGSRWNAGISFVSPGGAPGGAWYEQRNRPQVNGFLFAYPSSVQFLSSQVIAVGDSLVIHTP